MDNDRSSDALVMILVAHRGGSASAPENTLRAMRQAIEDGADVIECDVALSRDGEPVVIHLPFYTDSIRRLVGKKVSLGSTGWSDLMKLRVQGESIPHLDSVMALLREHPVTLCVEPKKMSERLLDVVIGAAETHGVEQQVVIATFYHRRRLLLYCKQKRRTMKTCVIIAVPWGASLEAIARNACADVVALGWRRWNYLRPLANLLDLKGRIAQAHAAGVEVYGGIADNEQGIKWLSELGVRGIITNNVGLARSVLNGELRPRGGR